jgi:hypothetical protein
VYRRDHNLRRDRDTEQHLLAISVHGRQRSIHLRVDSPDGHEIGGAIGQTHLPSQVNQKMIDLGQITAVG